MPYRGYIEISSSNVEGRKHAETAGFVLERGTRQIYLMRQDFNQALGMPTGLGPPLDDDEQNAL
jgi:hypothetical protein